MCTPTTADNTPPASPTSAALARPITALAITSWPSIFLTPPRKSSTLREASLSCAIALRVQAVRLLGTQAAEALAQLKDAAGKVDAFLAGVKKIEGQLVIASAVVGLASAALVGDAGGVLTAVVGVHDALKAAKA